MICSTCQKDKKKGKVNKGVFVCTECIAAATKSTQQKQAAFTFKRISDQVQRAENILYMVQHDLSQLKEDLIRWGAPVDREP